jgi:uncharacterized protein YbjT (DUF2867 family)
MRILMVGATGLLGGKVVGELLRQGDEVTALVRDKEAAAPLARQGVRLVLGDLKDAESLHAGLAGGFDGLITTAYGYSHRRKGDSLASVDDVGNRNLIAAAQANGVGRFVFTSILTADRATSVPHFFQKARTETELERSTLDWVALRPGGFLDTLLGFNAASILKGKLIVPTDLAAPASTILSDDLARYLAEAVRAKGTTGERIDIATERPTSILEIAEILTKVTGVKVTAARPPAPLMGILKLVAMLGRGAMADNLRAMEYVATGEYVADLRRQTEVFGPPPTLEDSIRKWINGGGSRA